MRGSVANADAAVTAVRLQQPHVDWREKMNKSHLIAQCIARGGTEVQRFKVDCAEG